MNLSNIVIPIPTITLAQAQSYVPFNISSLESVNISLPAGSPLGTSLSLKSFFSGQLNVSLDQLGNIAGFLSSSSFTNINIPLDPLINTIFNGGGNMPNSVNYNFTVVESFDDGFGKFPSTLGNVALVDCKYFQNSLIQTFNLIFQAIIS